MRPKKAEDLMMRYKDVSHYSINVLQREIRRFNMVYGNQAVCRTLFQFHKKQSRI